MSAIVGYVDEEMFPVSYQGVAPGVPVLTSDSSLKESLEVFARHDGERLPVLDNPRDRHLVGSLAKTDVLLTLAHGVGVGEAE